MPQVFPHHILILKSQILFKLVFVSKYGEGRPETKNEVNTKQKLCFKII